MPVNNQRDLSQSNLSTTVILFEEHPMVRSALAQNLRMQPGIQLLQVTPYLPSQPETILPLNPEVILIGLPQHSVTNIQTVASYVKVWANAGIAVIISTPYLKAEEEKLLFESGTFAYILKTIDGKRLRTIILTAKSFYRSSVDYS